jgi:hypothetical protein
MLFGSVTRRRREAVADQGLQSPRQVDVAEGFSILPDRRQPAERCVDQNTRPTVEIGPLVGRTGFDFGSAIGVIGPVGRDGRGAAEQLGQLEVREQRRPVSTSMTTRRGASSRKTTSF